MVGGILFPAVPENVSQLSGNVYEPYPVPVQCFSFKITDVFFSAAVGVFGYHDSHAISSRVEVQQCWKCWQAGFRQQGRNDGTFR